MNNYFIGIMTGTSADALDGCIVSFDEGFKFVESASISLDGDYKKNYEACIKAGYKTSSLMFCILPLCMLHSFFYNRHQVKSMLTRQI